VPHSGKVRKTDILIFVKLITQFPVQIKCYQNNLTLSDVYAVYVELYNLTLYSSPAQYIELHRPLSR